MYPGPAGSTIVLFLTIKSKYLTITIPTSAIFDFSH